MAISGWNALRARGQEPPARPPEAESPERGEDVLARAQAFIRPRPLEPIPDDPPPHEGAMIRLEYRIAPPDLITIEVLEALPGRPITGERLVRPDGKISLGFYGDLDVDGLTPEQAKVKILLHLRAYLEDQTLGLVRFDVFGGKMAERLRQLDPIPDHPPKMEEGPGPGVFDPVEPGAGARPDLPPLPTNVPPGSWSRRLEDWFLPTFPLAVEPRPADLGRPLEVPVGDAAMPQIHAGVGLGVGVDPGFEFAADPGKYVYEEFKDAKAVFIDISGYNSKMYYVQGDVANPGRLPWTGEETVFDALQFAGGLLSSADAKNVHLYRPARGGKPAKDYTIDLRAIERGDNNKNLQIFPRDRLVVERKAGLQPR